MKTYTEAEVAELVKNAIAQGRAEERAYTLELIKSEAAKAGVDINALRAVNHWIN